MSKKDYIDAVNEIQVDEKLKKETFKKIKENKKAKRYYTLYPIASLAFMCAIIMAVILPHKTIAPIEKVKYSEVVETGVLPKVENFSNLYGMLKERAKIAYEENKSFITTDTVMAENEMKNALDAADTKTERSEYSKTNTQVEGVDEADIVKTDGKYIYYLANDKLVITDVTKDSKLTLASKIEFDNEKFYPNELFLRGNRLIVIGTRVEGNDKKTRLIMEDCLYPDGKTFTVANVYNIENRANPVLDRTVEVEGNYVSSRMIGDNIYLVSNKYLYSYLCKQNKESELDEEEFKPQYIDTATDKEVKCINFDRIYYIPDSKDTSYLNIAGFNVTKNEPANIDSYLGAGNQIYSSQTNLYITKVNYNYEENKQEQKTEIYKFGLKDARCTFLKTGTVPGTALNQFSMDEKDGYFRIATTDSTSWNSESNTNNLYVLNENLDIVGKVEGLAPGEKIYSVRFMGNRAYMVTFVETDPLFVIDLKEPTNPRVLGELKIPGYSKYLHPYDETHLIGIGESTKVVNYGYGDRVITDGMKMSLFDVSDPSKPQEMYSVKIGNKGTYSEILYNHKALLFSKEKNIIAFPISITESEYEVKFQGAIVYNVSLEKGFELKGKITNLANETDKYYAKNNVDRIIYIKDTIYTLSKNVIKATDLNTMENRGSINIK